MIMEFPFTLEIAKKYGWRDKKTDLVWFRRWLEGNFDIEEDYNYDLLSQQMVVVDDGWYVLDDWGDMMSELYKNKILVVERNYNRKHKLYFPVKNEIIPRGDGFINGVFIDIELVRNNVFKFKRGWNTFSSPTYTDKIDGIFGSNATYTILGVFENKLNYFMNWNDNPLR